MGVFRSFSALTGCTAPSPQPGADQHQGGAPVRERPHHTGAPTDLTVQPLDHMVGTDARPVLAGEIAVGQRLLHAAADKFPDLILDHFLVQLYDLLGQRLLAPFECLCGNFIHPEPASYVFFFCSFSICATYCTLSNSARLSPNKLNAISFKYMFSTYTKKLLPT